LGAAQWLGGEFMQKIYFRISDHLARLCYAHKIKRGTAGGLVMSERAWFMPATVFVSGIVIFVAMVAVLRYFGAV
jgi:hypothetical protein